MAALACFAAALWGCKGDTLGCRVDCDPSHPAAARTDAGEPTQTQGGPASSEPPTDADGDLISDAIEGKGDSDGDGTPDYLDTDSDGDGIDDKTESGISTLGDHPVDSDSDGTPDYLDSDSDENGVPDRLEGAADPDGDRLGNYRDLDNDGDLSSDKLEIGPDATQPLDSDKDGTPDYLDTDSDGDTISDLEEQGFDFDGDGVPDRLDDDSDGDGILDRDEAGDADLATKAVDTDGDTKPDFRDTDSDGDGVPDQDEAGRGTDRLKADTDGDGVLDLVEIVACAGASTCKNDATDPQQSPRTRGNFVFFDPYQDKPSPLRDTLAFQTKIQFADVYLLMDTTGSMGGTIDSLKSSLSTPTTGLVDRVRMAIPNVRFGVGSYRDYGDGMIDRAYVHAQDEADDTTLAQAAVNKLTADGGGDGPEALVPALYSMATGLGLKGQSGWTGDRGSGYEGFGLCPDGTFGWPCFRFNAVPIVVVMTDAPSHNGPDDAYSYAGTPGAEEAPTYADALHALGVARARVIGIPVAEGEAQMQLERLAKDTGTVDKNGKPLVLVATSVGDAVVEMVRTLASQTPMDISVQFVDDASDTVDTQAAFLDHIEARVQGDPQRQCKAYPAVDTDGDGAVDTFQGVTPGDKVCFDVVVKQNATIEPTRDPQLFSAALRVVGQGRTELDRREIFFLVPPVIKLAENPIK